MLSSSSYLAGPARLPPFSGSATDNEAALPAFPSQGAWTEALRTHNPSVRRASSAAGRAHLHKIRETP